MKQFIFCSGVRVNEVSLRYNHPKKRKLPKINTNHDAEFILKQCFEQDRIALKEFFFALFISQSNDVLAVSCIGVGTEGGVTVSTKEIASCALLLNAKYVIIAHNHPGGSTHFSGQDLILTKRLKEALNLFKMDLLDHFIFTKNECISLLVEDESQLK